MDFSEKFLHYLPYLFFTILYSLSFGVIPYLDGNIDFIQSYNFYSGGLAKLISNWGSIHPPLKEIILYIFYKIFGVNTFSYSLLGYIFGIVGIYFVYKLSESLFNKSVATIAAFALSIYPLYLSVGIFSLTDFLTTVMLAVSFYLYSKRNFLVLAFVLSMSVLTKETAISYTLAIAISESMFSLLNINKPTSSLRKTFIKLLLLITPLIVFACWHVLLSSNGGKMWSDWNFSNNAGRGTVFTILNNLVTFGFFNKYAFQNWLQLVLLNFNWTYLTLAIGGVFVYIKNRHLLTNMNQDKTHFSMLLFFVFYFIAVLTFQTYTIPRYALPLVPVILIWSSYFISYIINRTKSKYLLVIAAAIEINSLFFSNDPFAISVWGKQQILNQHLYNNSSRLSGNDGITYNMQYIFIAKNRNQIIKSGKTVDPKDCRWLFADSNNDLRSFEILSITTYKKVGCLK